MCFHNTHSSISDEKKWADKLKGPLFFSHGKTNSCGVANGHIGNDKINISNKKNDKIGIILILDVKIEETNSVIVNIHNLNIEAGQVATRLNLG